MTDWLQGFAKVFFREIKAIASSSGIVCFCFYVPLFWILVVWGLLGDGIMEHVPVAFIDNDRTPLSRELTRAIAAQRTFSLEDWLEPAQALDAMQAGSVYGVLLIPAGYTRESLSGAGGSVVLWVDENRYAVAGGIRESLGNVLAAFNMRDVYTSALKLGMEPDLAKRALANVHSDFYSLGNEESSFLAFLGSTLLPSLIMIAAMFGFLTAFLRENWHHSNQEWLETANHRLIAAIMGKLLPWLLVYTLVLLFYMALFSGAGGFNITGSISGWLLMGMFCLMAFAFFALILAAIAPNWRMALVGGAGYSAPALPFTGFSIPQDSMGEAVRIFGECLPLTWFIQGQAQVWTLGASLGDLWRPLAALAILAFIPFIIGVPLMAWKLKKRIQSAT